MRVKWAKLYENAVVPTLGTGGAAGWDFTAMAEVEIPARSQMIIGTGIAAEIPMGWCGLIRGRSGFAKRSKCLLSDDYIIERRAARNAGVIDADYRGEIGVMLHNPTDAIVTIAKGQAFAQMVIVPCLIEGEEVPISELQRTIRGADGYGSTGDFRG
jgi:dUTP pyrophosphatase